MTSLTPSTPAVAGVTVRLIVLLALFGAITPFAVDMLLPGVPAMAQDLSVSVRNAGTSVSIFFIGMAVGQLIAGPLSDRLGRRPMILGGLACFIIGGLAATFAQSFPLLLAARLLQALGACSVTTCSRAAVRDMLDLREAARLFSLLALIGGLVPLIVPMVGNLLLELVEWRAIFAAMTLCGVLMLALALPTFRESRSHATLTQSRAENPLRAYRTLLGQPALIGILLAGSCNSGAMFTYIANSPAVLMAGYGLQPRAFTIAITVNSLGLVLFSHLNRHWLKTHSPARILALVAMLMAALAIGFLALAGPLAGQLGLLLVLLFALLCCAAVVQINTMAYALAIDPVRSGSSAALFGAATFASGALLSWLAARLHTSDGTGMALVIGFALIGGALSLLLTLRLVARSEAAPAERGR